MTRPVLFLLPLALAGCATGGSPRCAFLSGAEEVEARVVELDGSVEDEETFAAGPGEVLQTQTAWDAAVGRWGTDGGLTPDFGTHLVFVYRWIDGGCDEPVQYGAWHEGDALRLVAVEDDGGCDAYFPSLDLIEVAHGGATDIAWCAAE